MEKLDKYTRFESNDEMLEYVKEYINGKMLGSVEFNTDLLWVKPKPEDKSIHWKQTGRTTIVIEVFEPYKD